MKVKSLLGVIALCGAVSVSQAQNFTKKLSYRAEIGLGLTNLPTKVTVEDASSTTSLSPLLGVRIGGAVEYALTDRTFLTAGLTFRTVGTELELSRAAKKSTISLGGNSLSDVAVKINYLSLPVGIGHRFALTDNLNLAVEGNLYLAYGVSGSVYYDGGEEKEDAFSRKGENMSRLDAGVGLSLALEYQKYFFRLGVERGLGNLYSEKNKELQESNISYDTSVKMYPVSTYFTVGLRF